MTLRFGVLGAAKIAPDALIRPAAKRDDVEVAVVAARDQARAEAFADEHGISRVAADYEAVVTDPDVDVIFNPLPMSLHAEWTIRALEAGKHVLCEKPFASNASEARTMVLAAERSDRTLVEAFHWRYHPMADAITEAIATLGPLRGGEARFSVPIPDRTDIRWLWNTSGGSLMDLGCYTVQWARHAFGPTATVERASATTDPDADPRIDASMEAHLRFGGGARCRIESSMVAEGFDVALVVEGDHGSLRVTNPLAPHLFNELVLDNADGSRTWQIDDDGTTYDHQLAAFVTALAEGTPLPTGGRDSIQTMEIIDAIYDIAGLPRRGT